MYKYQRLSSVKVKLKFDSSASPRNYSVDADESN